MSFKETYNKYKNLVFNVALQYVKNLEDAEEITQDVFVKVYKNLSQFRYESELKTWIYRITINTSLDYLRKGKRNKSQLFQSTDFSVQDRNNEHVFFHPSSEMDLDEKEALRVLLEKIGRLPDKQKTVVLLLKIEDLSQKEVSKILNISEKAVESLFQRAKQNLKKMLEGEGN